MAANRVASRAMPLLSRRAPRVSRMRSAGLPRDLRPVALVLPYRAVQTDTSSSTNSPGEFPPPGYDADKAKRPLQRDQQQAQSEQSSKANSSSASGATVTREDVRVPKNEPTAQSKTAAAEAQSLTELATTKAKAESGGKEVSTKKVQKKMTLWQKIKHEAVHYWDGTKLLATEVRISSKLALRMAAGYELTRREHRQLQRTVQDLGRLVPFSVFVIVPFAELLLPVALRLFPNLLPSTYEGKEAKDKKASNLRTTRKETSKFLRQTLRETGLPLNVKETHKAEFTAFFKKIRASGENPSKQDVIKICKLFKDDLTLDNLSRPQLVGICRYMNLNPIGPDTVLRYQIRHRMRQIKRDDRAISYEGVDSLSVPELQTACASRGLRTHGVSPGRLRDDLCMWLELRLKYGVPSTLLVLSNAFAYSQTGSSSKGGDADEFDSLVDALQSVLSAIPEELFHEIELEVHTAEGAATNRQRLEVLKEQEELIQEERHQQAETAESGRTTPSDMENIDEGQEGEDAGEVLQAQASEAADAEEQRAMADAREAEPAAAAAPAEKSAKEGGKP